jgi:hypothetical protein
MNSVTFVVHEVALVQISSPWLLEFPLLIIIISILLITHLLPLPEVCSSPDEAAQCLVLSVTVIGLK